MDDRRRDIAVGLTVLVALLMFSAMVVIFTGVPSALQTGYSLEIAFPSTNGAKSGDPVRLAGAAPDNGRAPRKGKRVRARSKAREECTSCARHSPAYPLFR